MNRTRKISGIPVLKLPPSRLLDVVLALKEHEYDRDGFKERVLSLFSGKEDKSVFRGMAIPTLRGLGILIGFDQEMHLSGDGAIIAEAYDRKKPNINRPLQLILNQIERARGLDGVWQKQTISVQEIRRAFSYIDTANNDKTPRGDFPGRLNRWLNYLEFFLIIEKKENNYHRLQCQSRNKNPDIKAIKAFIKDFLLSYKKQMPRGIGEPVISIEAIHRELALRRWKADGNILIRSDFDNLLSKCLESDMLDVHLHRSMGAEQGLFLFKGIAYQTISIREN